MHIDNRNQIRKISLYQAKNGYAFLPDHVKDAYEKEMLLRLSWNTNHLEGNTLSLDETIHPFREGNGRTGRVFLNQHLIKQQTFPGHHRE